MGVMAQLKLEGLEELQRRIMEKKAQMRTVLDMKLTQIAEEAVAHAKIHKGYRDHTANLKNSISYALFYDGELLTMKEGAIPKPEEAKGGQQGVTEMVEKYANEAGVVAPRGYSLIIVAGMEYGKYVEDKGYNVLYLTRYFLEDELQKALDETIEDVLG